MKQGNSKTTSMINNLTEQERDERALTRKRIKENYKFNKNLTAHHISFLKDLEHGEDGRLAGIENKLSSIIGQSGVVFTLIALFIPLFLNELSQVQVILKCFYCIIFLVGLFFFTKSILNASATLKIYDFPYARPDINSALSETIKKEKIFLEEQVKDLITTLSINTSSNNKKGNNLIRAHSSFVFGLITMGVLGLTLTFQSLFSKKETDVDIALLHSINSMEMQITQSRNLLDDIRAHQMTANDSIKLIQVSQTIDSVVLSLKKTKGKLERTKVKN